MGEEKIVVKILSEVDRKLTIETAEGKERVYYRDPIRTMHMRVDTLRIERSQSAQTVNFEFGKRGDLGPLPALTSSLVGSVTLEGRSIAVIGDPKSETQTLSIRFRPLDDQARIDAEQLAQEEDKPLRSATVAVGFSRSDWEIGNDDEWFIDCHLPQGTFDALSAAVESGKLEALSLGLQLTNVYSDDDWAPPAMRTNWFLRPNRSDGTIDFPEMAHGDVRVLCFTHPEVILRPKAYPDEPDQGFDVEEAAVPTPDLTVTALNTLARNIETLHGTLKLLGWLVVGALVILAFK